jgi:hypothetical protein
VLYLAQVNQKKGIFHRSKELKLLARLGAGMVWHSLPYGRVIPSTKASPFNCGTLVVAEIKDTQEVVEVKEATQLILSSLANVSLLHRKVREHQQEIDEWKSSLVYQNKVLNQRKLEIEKYLSDICPEDIEELLQDLRQVYYQYFQVNSASKKMIVFEGEIEDARNQLENHLMHVDGLSAE